MKKKFPINYTSKEFDSIKSDLVNYAKRYYPDTFRDFSDAGFGSLMLDTVAYVGDIMSYYIDYQANESFLVTAIEGNNIQKIANQLGYKFKNTSTAAGKIAIYAVLPANTFGTNADLRYAPILRKGSTFTNGENNVQFILVEDVDFNNKNLESIVAKVDSATGNPQYYALKAYGKVISGVLGTETIQVGNFTKFNKIDLQAKNVAEIISVMDSEGNEYFEVDYLSQNVVYKSIINNSDDSVYAPNRLIPYVASRRFITEINSDTTTLIFGGGHYNPDVEMRPDLLAEPSRKVLELYGAQTISDKYLDPFNLINNDKFGIGPENTTLTITYRYNTSQNTNIPTNSLTVPLKLDVSYRKQETLSNTILRVVSKSIEISNEEPIVGGLSVESNEEIRQNVLSNFHSQNRIVTQLDYETACYNIPSKYGSIKRARALKDKKSLKNNINLYVISEQQDGSLFQTPSTVKENLKTWLNKNRILSDTVDILDAKIINIGINFTGLSDPSYNSTEILNKCLAQLKYLFDQKPQIGQPISLTDIYRELRKVTGLLDVKSVEIVTKAGANYSNIPYDIKANTNSDERYIFIPYNAIYEIKNFNLDVIGNIQ